MSDAPIEIGHVELGDASVPASGEPSRPKSRIRLIILGILLTVALAASGVLAYTAWQIVSQKDAKLSAPVQVGPLRLDDSADGKSTADYLQTALAAEVDLDKTIGAIYLDGTGKDVLFFGGTTLIWTPDSELDTAFTLIADNQGAVTGLHDVAPGKLGGTMRCGTTKSDDGNLTVCGWADHGSIALALFLNRSDSDAAALLRQIREATQSR